MASTKKFFKQEFYVKRLRKFLVIIKIQFKVALFPETVKVGFNKKHENHIFHFLRRNYYKRKVE